MTSAAFSSTDLVRRYNRKAAVCGVSLKGFPGETIALVGPNGCGKTTLVEMLLGLRKPDSGSAEIFGLPSRRHRKEIAGRLGVTLQGASLHAQVTPFEHLEFVAALYRKKASAAREILEDLDLQDSENTRYRKLSGGQQRRTMVAGALLGEPKLLVLDEPTSGVDMESKNLLWDVVRSCASRFGSCVFITTHDLGEAEDNADRVCVMREGRVRGFDAPSKLVEQSGLVEVFEARHGGGPLAGSPQDAVVLRKSEGVCVFGSPSAPCSEKLEAWLEGLGGVRVDRRRPRLEDAYLMMEGRGEAPSASAPSKEPGVRS